MFFTPNLLSDFVSCDPAQKKKNQDISVKLQFCIMPILRFEVYFFPFLAIKKKSDQVKIKSNLLGDNAVPFSAFYYAVGILISSVKTSSP